MAMVIAIHAIVISDPDQPDPIHTGRYDLEGNPVLKKISLKIKPGEWFDYDGPDLPWLIENDHCRYPTESETALHEMGL